MRTGSITSIPDDYTNFAKIRDSKSNITYTVPSNKLPEDVDVGDEYAYKVDLWGNDSGLVYYARED